MTKLDEKSLWKLVLDADKSNYIMTLSTPQAKGGDAAKCLYNLPCSHAYSLLGVLTILTANQTEINLFRVRNPWMSDASFTGSFKDNSEIWKTVGYGGKTYAR